MKGHVCKHAFKKRVLAFNSSSVTTQHNAKCQKMVDPSLSWTSGYFLSGFIRLFTLSDFLQLFPPLLYFAESSLRMPSRHFCRAESCNFSAMYPILFHSYIVYLLIQLESLSCCIGCSNYISKKEFRWEPIYQKVPVISPPPPCFTGVPAKRH